MKPSYTALAAILLFFATGLFAQNKGNSVLIKTGELTFEPALRSATIDAFNIQEPRYHNKALFIVRFNSIPPAATRQLLMANGITLLDYIAENTYTAAVTGQLKLPVLQQAGSNGILRFLPRYKLAPMLNKGVLPAYAVKVTGTVDVTICFAQPFSLQETEQLLTGKNITIIERRAATFNQLSLRIAANRLQELAGYPFIQYIEPVLPEPVPLNQNSRELSRGNVLNTSIANGGKGLNGEGMAIGIGDNADIQRQIDFTGRFISRNFITSQSHGIHITGTAAGAGIIDERYRGYAPRATIISDVQPAILYATPEYARDHNMVVTNNSYGTSPGCDLNGWYGYAGLWMDQMALQCPQVLHVFAAGNAGSGTNCTPYPFGFNSLAYGYQAAKNVITVGATNDIGTLAALSSRGPARTGRLKPEITAMGESVISNWSDNIYIPATGTSVSSPAVAGGALLLYQRYRQLHANSNPGSGLIKAVLCNGADDRGNPGPDFSYGFGVLNLVRSIGMLEQEHYFVDSIANGITKTHTITVPANTAQLKVMLYWNDPGASPLNTSELVNDLDATIVTPASVTVLPKVLDTLPQNVNNTATNGADHLNNIEQVLIDNPPAGNYSIKIKGTAIAQGNTQPYFVVYDAVPVSVSVTYPTGGEGLVPGELVKLSWDAYGNATSTYNLEYSIDNGNTWLDIAAQLPAESRAYTWLVPGVASSNALIRVTQNGTGVTAISRPFVMIGLPVISLSPSQCEGSIVIQWPAVPDASDYEVMMLKGDAMQSVGVTGNTSWYINGLSADTLYWVGVRARINGKAGRRSVAVSYKPNNGNCSDPFFNNNLELDSILSPVTGRKFTSTALTPAQAVKVRIKNLDDAPCNGFYVMYAVNGGAWKTDTVHTTIAAGAAYEHIFTATTDLAVTGSYTLTAVVKNLLPDAVAVNDTLVSVVRQLDNQPITINVSTVFKDDLETAAAVTYRSDIRGIKGIDRYDFENALATGQFTTFLSSGIASSGERSFILSEHTSLTGLARGLNTIIGTFNLAGKSATANNVRLDFKYRVHLSGTNNDVWIRGSDTQPWIKVFDYNGKVSLSTDTAYRMPLSIEVADSLAAYGQDFTSSFQVRWRESGNSAKLYPGRLYSIDDIRLYEVQNDLQMVSIDMPVALVCGLSSTAPVKISLFNTNNTALTNVPVRYALNDGNWVTEIIPVIAANTKMQYQFNKLADLSTPGPYRLKTAVSYTGDTYAANDSATLVLTNLPLIDSYPYLQDFELGSGGWYTEGGNSSWEYGTPIATGINGAASGAKAWKTKLAGRYNENEYSYLYSPCYQINGMTKPTLSFSFAIDMADCNNLGCDIARVEYTVNGGTTWQLLGLQTDGSTNWYNNVGSWQSLHYTRWHVATVPIPVTTGLLRFRFSMSADTYISAEGMAVDDVHVYDNDKGIYDGPMMVSGVTKQVAGNNWIDFESNGKLVASIHPNGQSMGATTVQAYINTGKVRYTGSQYYHNRNLVIKPAVMPNDSVTVRFYFLDKESDSLVNASGCLLCSKPASAYTLGVSKYSNTTIPVENGTVDDDNLQGNWSFISSVKVKTVPFDKGYYAEFKVKDFSEFWLNSGGPDNNSALPAVVFDFTARKTTGSDVLLEWKTGNETGITKYEVEVARSTEAFQNNAFVKIGEVAVQPGQLYRFTDAEADKFGARYYRLKVLYANGSFNYSPVRTVVFNEAALWTIYPNPSTGLFYLAGRFAVGQPVNARIIDAKGRLIRQYTITGTGFTQKITVDLSNTAAGIYFLRLDAGDVKQVYKLYKQ